MELLKALFGVWILVVILTIFICVLVITVNFIVDLFGL